MHIIRVLAVLGVCLAAAAAAAADFGDLDQFAQQIASQGLFSGMIHAEQGGKLLFSKGFGHAVPELEVPMRNDHRFPIGSNTKFFTAVAVWQLHKAGKLSVFAPVSAYFFNDTELGLPPGQPWCPRTKDAPAGGPCQTPQLQHLLRMAGGVLGFDNCAYDQDAWQQQYCLTGPLVGGGLNNLSNILAMEAGQVGISAYIRASGVLDMPLDFGPGTSYHYSNPGFAIAGYVIEKVSGLPLATYFQRFIFDKAGLSRTLYDVSNGILGLHKGMLPFPAYVSYLAPVTVQFEATAGSDMQQLEGAVGSLQSYGFGDIRSSQFSYQQLQPPPGSPTPTQQTTGGLYAFTARYPGPSNIDWTLANAAGAIVSTPQDMAAWFRVLLRSPSRLGLDRDTVKQMLSLTTVEPRMPTYNNNKTRWLYAQGVVVVPDATHPLGVSHLYYLGSLGGFLAAVYQSLHPTDPSQDVFVNVLTATVLPATSTWPAGIQTDAAGNCKWNPAAAGVGGASARQHDGEELTGVPGVLCEVKGMVPSMLTTVHDLLARKAVQAITGKLWFDLQY